MTAAFAIALLWLAFAGSHMALSSIDVRRRLVTRLGEGPFLGVYSLVAFATFIPLVWVYLANRHQGPLLWSVGAGTALHTVVLLVAGLGFALAVASFFQPSATGLDPRASKRARGLTRITRHPLFVPLAIWGLAHVVVNGYLTDLVFFGGMFAYGIAGCAHQDARKQVTHAAELRAFFAETSLLPFGAIVGGRNRLAIDELPWLGLVTGVAAAASLYLLHPWMFGRA